MGAGVSVLLLSLLAWRVAVVAVWLGIAIGAADVVMHLFDTHPHAHALRQRRQSPRHHRNERS
jgi:hypothetical protein